MPPRFRAVLAVALPLLLATVAAGGVTAQTTGDAPGQFGTDDQRANTTMVVELRADGDARWHVSTTFNLTTENETTAYRELAASFSDGNAPALGLDAYRRASALASDDTGREMAIADVRRQTAPDGLVANGTGRLTVSFTWTNFARTEAERVVIGDAFESGWLPGLEAGQTLEIHAPDGFSVFDSEVPPENATLRWTGPQDLQPTMLSATFTGSPGGSGTPSGPPGDSGTMLWVGMLAVGLGGGLAVYAVVRRSDGLPVPGSGSEPDEPAPTAGPDEGGGAAAAEPPADEGTDSESVDTELLSDEERVEHLLERNDGRMRQADIVKETGWSNAKVSQLLSSMEEEGQIDKLRMGRENLISFPDEDLTDLEE